MQVIEQADLTSDFEGYNFGSTVSVIFEKTERPGAGPRLHQHPYAETFIIRTGRALFTVAEEQLIAVGGQILVVPGFTPHKFSVLDGGLYEAIHIHENDRFITEWLEDRV
jgi:mannose-6-phosphate isomerase-like protein (cupin superfamily)